MTQRPVHQQARRSERAWLGQLAGTTRIVGLTLLALAAGTVILPLMATKGTAQGNAPIYTVLYNFTGGADGGGPSGGLIRDAAGNLYGTAVYGGTYGSGAVFKVDPAGNETVLDSFTGGTDGGYPSTGLIRDAAGNLYGTTSVFGTYGVGVAFKLDPAGNETVLHAFTGGADGGNPSAGLIRDSAGNLYGTTYQGGNTSCFLIGGCGVAFKLDPAGNETVLHAFTGGADGSSPIAGLIRDAAGNLYGSTQYAGTGGFGVAFKMDPAGNETVPHSFTSGTEGADPEADLVRDGAGNLYGTTRFGGDLLHCNGGNGCGVVFKLDPAGNETVLYTFTGGLDGGSPFAALVLDPAGNLGGTTYNGGNTNGYCSPFGCGVVFKVDQKGNETVLHEFCPQSGCVDGAYPSAGLLRDRAGDAYGTAYNGGAYGAGVVFKLSPH